MLQAYSSAPVGIGAGGIAGSCDRRLHSRCGPPVPLRRVPSPPVAACCLGMGLQQRNRTDQRSSLAEQAGFVPGNLMHADSHVNQLLLLSLQCCLASCQGREALQGAD